MPNLVERNLDPLSPEPRPELSPLEELQGKLFTSDVRTTRHLTQAKLEGIHSQSGASPEDIEELTKKYAGEYTDLSEELYKDELDKQKVTQHIWTYAEDEFIKKNYMHLSDNVIGLALNVPSRLVAKRRSRLNCFKGQVKELNKVIIWCDRANFELDCQEQQLTKARG